MSQSTSLGTRRLLRSGSIELGVELTDGQADKIVCLLDLLDRWNATVNLTSIKDRRDQVIRHVLDSLAIRPFLSGHRVLDVGTGAGFPGLPLAISDPSRSYVLLDTSGKKIRFVRHVILSLELVNATAEQNRVEDYLCPTRFDTIVTRAFSSLAEIPKLTGHLVADNGRILAMKGKRHDSELKELHPDWAARVHELSVPGLDRDRCVIELRPVSDMARPK